MIELSCESMDMVTKSFVPSLPCHVARLQHMLAIRYEMSELVSVLW